MKWLRAGFAVLALTALITWVGHADLVRVIGALSLPWAAASAASVLAATALGALNAWLMVARRLEIRFLDFLPVYWSGWAFGLVVPGQVGDLAGMAVLLRRHEMDWHISLGRLLLDKLLSLFVMVTAGAVGLVHYVDRVHMPAGPWPSPLYGALLLVVAGLTALALRAHPMLARVRALLGSALRELVETAAAHPGRIAANFSGSVLKLGLTGLAYWSMLQACGARDLPLATVTALAAASSLVAYIPISVNGLGTVEAAGLGLFGALDVTATQVLVSFLALRLIVFALAWLPLGLWWILRPGAGSRRAPGAASGR